MCKNVLCVCYELYDLLIYINENFFVWDKVDEFEYIEVYMYRDRFMILIIDENKVVDIFVKWWIKKYLMVEG